ncbi:uncharacterized protein LOC135195715 [Macrobrachium nipponense]|uniref:uncharacterized protein LOC135195715 n=1 Tax=Macrobrachium nipponense TaxID=159736 RepID=UPI0030C87745
MSKRVKVLHRQTFQNSNNIVELTVKTIPKDIIPSQNTVPKPSEYVRDCGVRKELERVSDKENNNVCSKASVPNKKKDNDRGRVTVEVSKKVNRRHHEIVPKNNTWDDVLRNNSVVESSIESELVSGSRKKRLANHHLPDQCQAWHQRASPTADSEQSNVSELIVNRQIQSETSSQEFAPQQMYNNVNGQNIIPQRRNSSSSSSKITRKQPRAERSTRRSLKNINQQAATGMQPEQLLEQAKVPGNNRLLSDDATPSPFGASALQLLSQLRQRLQSRGDSEGMDIIGVVEAYIAGQGSNGAVGSGNIQQSATAASPGFSPVFPTPTTNNPVSVADNPFNTGGVPVPTSTEAHKPSHLPNHTTKPNPFRADSVQNHGTNTESYPIPGTRTTNAHPGFQSAHGVTVSHTQVPGSSAPNRHVGFRSPHYLNEGNSRNNQNLPSSGESTSQKDNQGKQITSEELIREIIRQKSIIVRQENDILQLRTLSTRLIAMQEKLTSQNSEVDANRNTYSSGGQVTQTVRHQNQECQTEDNHLERPTRDWESNTPSSDRDYWSTVMLLQTENDCLREEVRRLQEIITELQNQLTRAYADLDSERRSRSRLSGMSSSKLSGSAPNLDFVERHLRGNIPEKLVPAKQLSNQGESEVDSAYEEKTSSRVTSKVGSPHSDRQDTQESKCERSIPPLSNVKTSSCQQQNHKNNVGMYNSNQHLNAAQGPSRETTAPSITRNASLSLEPIPVCHSAFPSVELLNSNSHTPKRDVSEQNYILPENQRFHGNAGQNSVRDRQSTLQSPTSNQNKESVNHNTTPSCSATELISVNDDFAIVISDIVHKPGQILDDPVYPSFSTVSEESQNEFGSYRDSEFLHGIPFEKLRDHDATEGKRNSDKEKIHSLDGIQNPTMESTRVQERSPPVNTRSSTDISYVTMKGTSTLKSVVLDNVEELQ